MQYQIFPTATVKVNFHPSHQFIYSFSQSTNQHNILKYLLSRAMLSVADIKKNGNRHSHLGA